MVKIIDGGLTYDDVLLVPKKTSVNSRKEISTETYLTKNIKLQIPIISSPMDTVTEAEMAIAMAQHGGIGIIHRYMSIQEQAMQVSKVKRADSIVIENPYRININSTISDVKNLMQATGTHGILVVDDEDYLQGIVTSRDIIFEDNLNKKVTEVMTPKSRLITAPVGISLEDAKEILKKNKIEKLPLVDEKGKVKGLITARSIINKISHPHASMDKKGRLLVGAAVGVKKDLIERTEALLEAGADIINIDVAHGHADYVINAIKQLRKNFGDIPIMCGSVATGEAVKDLAEAGADTIRVGIGSGSICITRLVTGAGVPQLSAIIDCAKVAEDYGIPLVADGGIRRAGDITKALAAGASTVMIGSLFAGTDEAPGTPIIKDGKKYKVIRGLASLEARIEKEIRERGNIEDEEIKEIVAEGVQGFVPYRGSVVEVLNQLIGGLRSGMSYCGARNIEELRKNAVFIKISEAAFRESLPHDIEFIK